MQLHGAAIPGLRDDAVTLVHRAVFSDREVVVGFTRCDGAEVPCGLQQPFWLDLQSGAGPSLRRMPGVWASTGAGAVTATDSGVQVNLGVWNGERRAATLTAAGNIVVSRTPEPSQAAQSRGLRDGDSGCGVLRLQPRLLFVREQRPADSSTSMGQPHAPVP